MSSSTVKVSIVCPAYQEEEVLPLFHKELSDVLAELPGEYDCEIVYVDDGSRDGTLDYLRSLALSDERVRYLSLSRNFGHQAALTAGLEQAVGDVIIMMDSDLQQPPRLIPDMLAKWKEGHEIVLTVRDEDDLSLSMFKRFTSRAFYKVMGWMSETEVHATAADFRLMGRASLDALLKLNETHRFLRGMVNWLGYKTAVLPYRSGSRRAGTSKYSLRRMVKLATDGMLSFSKVPLRLSLLLGALALVVGKVYLAAVLLGAGFGHPPSDWGSVFAFTALLVLDGFVLLSLGIVGEYVGRIYDQVKGRPLYLLKESSPQKRCQEPFSSFGGTHAPTSAAATAHLV
jgi:dolichol-phosphate mannosyltransferase